ncbi:MAG: glycosyltransferase family 39 protein [Rickettsiales bacterium]
MKFAKTNDIAPLFCLLVLAIHWLNQWHGTYGLMFDEAQYWYWAKHLAWGYYSKPPMIAWLMAASTALFGDGNFGAKMLAPVILLLTGAVLYATARRLNYSSYIASWVLITYVTLPVVTGNSAFFTTDVPLQLCWAVALYATVTALCTARPHYWLLAGTAVGLGMLSKYTMIAFAVSGFLALLLTKASRQQLRSAWPWAGACIALLLIAPNLLWNAQHHFVTFNHTNDNVFSKRLEIYPEDMFVFIASQFAVFGPILLMALIYSIKPTKRSDNITLLHCFVWPLAVVGIVVSLLAGAQAHWIAPVYLSAILIVVPMLARRAAYLLPLSLTLHLIVMALFYAAPAVVPTLGFKRDPFARLFVWNTLADELKPLISTYPDAIIMTNERKIAAAFTYQLRDSATIDKPVYKWKAAGIVRDHYDLVTENQNLAGKPALLVLRTTVMDAQIPRSDARLLRQLTLQKYPFSVYLLPSY